MIYKTYKNILTGEIHTEFLKSSEHDKYLLDNPDMIHIIVGVNVVDPVGAGIIRPPSDFLKHVVGKVKETHPLGTALERRWPIPREW